MSFNLPVIRRPSRADSSRAPATGLPWRGALRAFAAPPAGSDVTVDLDAAPDGGLLARWQFGCPGLRLPPAQPPARRDELWRHVCGEIFMADAAGEVYREFNFAPDGSWAIYDFAAYRARLPDPLITTPPVVSAHLSDRVLSLAVTLPAACLPDFARVRLGLCAVLESEPGGLGYWALSHVGAQPDFHRAESFLLALDVSLR